MSTKLHNNQWILHTRNSLLPKLQSKQSRSEHLHTMLLRILHERPIHLLTLTKRMRNGQQYRILLTMFRRICCQLQWYLLYSHRILSDLSTCYRTLSRVYTKLLLEHQSNMRTNVIEQLFVCQFNGTMYSMCTKLRFSQQYLLPSNPILLQPLDIIIHVSPVHSGLLSFQQNMLQNTQRLQ